MNEGWIEYKPQFAQEGARYYYKQEGETVIFKAEMPEQQGLVQSLPNSEGKCYDWSNKNLRVVEWVRCSDRMPEDEEINKLCAIEGDVGVGTFYAVAIWAGKVWREEDREGFVWGKPQVKRWLLLPDVGEE